MVLKDFYEQTAANVHTYESFECGTVNVFLLCEMLSTFL